MSGTFNLNINHSTTYHFSNPVFLEPHILIFTPAHEFYFTLTEQSIEITPRPKGRNFFRGIEGQQGEVIWFEGKHRSLEIDMKSRLNVTPYNPFNFIIHPGKYSRHPFVYPRITRAILGQSLKLDEAIDDKIIRYASDLLKKIPTDEKGKRNIVTVLAEVTESVHRDHKLIERLSGPPQSLSITYRERQGSCRDLAYFLINLLRYWKIAARFVSGYLYLEITDEEPQFELHGWVEAYVPGPGWIGLDPSHGVYTDHHYIAVARSVRHNETLPVTGTFRGKADSTLITEVDIRKETIPSIF